MYISVVQDVTVVIKYFCGYRYYCACRMCKSLHPCLWEFFSSPYNSFYGHTIYHTFSILTSLLVTRRDFLGHDNIDQTITVL